MLPPSLLAWVKQRRDYVGLWIDPREVASLMKITFGACQSEVFEIIAAAVFARNDMLDLERDEWGFCLTALAVFTAFRRSLTHSDPKRGIHASRFYASETDRRNRA